MRVFVREFVLACAFAAMSATSALAGPAAIAVRIDRATLTDDAAVEALHARIVRAARKVCEADDRLSSYGWAYRLACVREKTDEAVRVANIPALSVLHAARADAAPQG